MCPLRAPSVSPTSSIGPSLPIAASPSSSSAHRWVGMFWIVSFSSPRPSDSACKLISRKTFAHSHARVSRWAGGVLTLTPEGRVPLSSSMPKRLIYVTETDYLYENTWKGFFSSKLDVAEIYLTFPKFLKATGKTPAHNALSAVPFPAGQPLPASHTSHASHAEVSRFT